jgi:hypothetical protein
MMRKGTSSVTERCNLSGSISDKREITVFAVDHNPACAEAGAPQIT